VLLVKLNRIRAIQSMQANPPEKVTRRVTVILEVGGSSRNLLDVVLPLLGPDKAVEMQGVFLEEAELKHAADLPFVKELCRVTFSIREFNSDQFERALALRMRTAQRALSVLAKRAGVAHSFRNVRGSAISLLVETANQSDITIFKPARMMAAAMSPRPYKMPAQLRISPVVTCNVYQCYSHHQSRAMPQRWSACLRCFCRPPRGAFKPFQITASAR